MSNIKLYSISCQKCIVLETKLKQAGIKFDLITDQDKVLEVGKAHGISGAPILEVDDTFYDFSGAISYLREATK